MNILGIDYGRRKMGLAQADGILAEPLQVIHYKDTDEMFTKLLNIINLQSFDKIVVGMSEGGMAIEIKNFIDALKTEIKIPVEEFDETLTSKDASLLAREAGIKRKKRRQMEDAYTATLMLQGYLDSL